MLGEEISMEELGGARLQAEISGNAHFANSESECFDQIRKLVTSLPDNNRQKAQLNRKTPSKITESST